MFPASFINQCFTLALRRIGKVSVGSVYGEMAQQTTGEARKTDGKERRTRRRKSEEKSN